MYFNKTLLAFALFMVPLTSCIHDDYVDIVVIIDDHNNLGVTIEEREKIQGCRSNPISEESVLKLHMVGDWELIAYGCGFCTPHEDPEININFTSSNGRIMRKYKGEPTEEQLFQWTTFTDSIWSPDAEQMIPAARVKTEPLIFEIGGVICQDFMAFDYTPGDAQMIIFKKW